MIQEGVTPLKIFQLPYLVYVRLLYIILISHDIMLVFLSTPIPMNLEALPSSNLQQLRDTAHNDWLGGCPSDQ
jgi:hypothetical protein